MKMKKKHFLYILVFVLILTSGCIKEEELKEIETIQFRITWKAYSERGEAIQAVVNSFNDSHADVQVNMISGNEDKAEIETLFSIEEIPEVFVLPYRYVQSMAYEENLMDLSEFFEEEMEVIYPSLIELGTHNDKIYGFPWVGHSMAVIYNKDLLSKAQVSPEDIHDFESWVESMNQIESKTSARGIGLVGQEHHDLSWMINQFIYGFDGQLVDSEKRQVLINSPESIAGIDFYINTLGAHAQESWKGDSGVEVMDAFRNQEVAYEIQGPWGITDIWKNGNPFEVGVLSLVELGGTSEVGPLMLAIPEKIDDSKKEAALEFIHFMLTKETQSQIMDGEYSPKHDSYYPFRVPVRNDLAEDSFFIQNPEFNVFIEGFSNPSIDVPIPEWEEIRESHYIPGLHKVINGELSIEAFLDDFETIAIDVIN